MKQYIFTKTYNSGRGMHTGFPIWDIEMFLKDVSENGKESLNMYRYGCIGGYMHNLKDMSLEEFEKIFPEHPFTEDQITELFRKEVSLKYGEHKQKALLKAIPKKDLIKGRQYNDLSGSAWVYLGEVEKTVNKMAYKSEWEIKRRNYVPEVTIGYGFIPAWRLRYNEHADNTQVLKTIKKLVSEADDKSVYPFPESEELVYHSGECHEYHQRVVTVKIQNKW